MFLASFSVVIVILSPTGSAAFAYCMNNSVSLRDSLKHESRLLFNIELCRLKKSLAVLQPRKFSNALKFSAIESFVNSDNSVDIALDIFEAILVDSTTA